MVDGPASAGPSPLWSGCAPSSSSVLSGPRVRDRNRASSTPSIRCDPRDSAVPAARSEATAGGRQPVGGSQPSVQHTVDPLRSAGLGRPGCEVRGDGWRATAGRGIATERPAHRRSVAIRGVPPSLRSTGLRPRRPALPALIRRPPRMGGWAPCSHSRHGERATGSARRAGRLPTHGCLSTAHDASNWLRRCWPP